MSEKVRIDVNLDTILFYALKRLIDLGVCTSTSGIIGQNPDKPWVPPSTNYYVLSARKQNLLNAEASTWAGELTVRTYAFSGLDIAMRDYISLTQRAGAGIQTMINAVIQAFQLYDMTSGGFYFLAYPMRYDHQDDIHREVDKDSPAYGWSYCDIVFQLVYGEDPTYYNPNVNNANEFTAEYDGSFI